MQFLFPTFLWAIGLLAIPVIIHLFYFRRFKKVAFTNVRLLKEIKEETASRNKLKDLIILFTRLLALLFLILAFAQPFIPRGEQVKKGTNVVSIFVDNSFSMNAVNDQTPIIDISKEKARQILNAYSNSDNFQILTHDFEGRHQRLVTQEDALSLIDEIEVSPSVQNLSSIINRQEQILSREDANRISYIISDFQASIMDEVRDRDTTVEVNLVPIQSVRESNVAIDSIWLESGVAFQGQSNKLLVKIQNYSEETAENIRLSIAYNGQEKPEGRFTIPGRSTITDTIVMSIFQPGWQLAEVKISDYPIQFDDNYWVSFYVDELLEILVINDGRNDRYLQALFGGLPAFNLVNSTPNTVNYGDLGRYKLVIIHNLETMSSGMQSALSGYIENGGKVLYFPDEKSDLNSINQFLSNNNTNELREITGEERQVSRINTDEFIFNDVFQNFNQNLSLPIATASFKITNFQSRPEEKLLTFRDGGSYLSKYQKGAGLMYLCSSPLNSEFNNLVLNAEIFVPMVFKMAIAQPISQPISYTIGNNDPIEIKKTITGNEIVFKVIGETEFIPSQLNLGPRVILNDNDQIKTAGNYQLMAEDKVIKKLAFNYNRIESDPSVVDVKTLDLPFNILDNTLSADLTTMISEKDRGIILWKWCLVLSLIFFAVESLLLRLWKK